MLRTLIVDDEAPARRRLRRLLQPLQHEGRLHVVAEAGDGEEALEHLRASDVDLLFLDIQMPELNGFDVLERLPRGIRPVVVFTTAYDAYALRAFEANAVDYLLKPIEKERLREAVSRAERLRGQSSERDERLDKLLDWIDRQADPETPPPPDEEPAESAPLRQLSVSYKDRILLISTSRLISAEINEGITRFYVLEDPPGGPRPRLRQHVTNYTLDQLESHLDPEHFLRVHRSAIVQIDHIQEMIPWFSGRYKLVLTGSHEVIASRERSKTLKDRLLL